MNQYKFKYQPIFSATFYEINEEDQSSYEIELYIKLNINHNLTESDIDNIDGKSQLKHQIQNQEIKESGWKFDNIISNIIGFYKTGEIIGSSHVKIPLSSNAILKLENKDKFCFLRSTSACLHPCEDDRLNRVPIYKQFSDERNIEAFDFSNGFSCSDVHTFENFKILSINIFELNFYQDENNWKHFLFPIAFSKNESVRVVDLLIYKNLYAPTKHLKVL